MIHQLCCREDVALRSSVQTSWIRLVLRLDLRCISRFERLSDRIRIARGCGAWRSAVSARVRCPRIDD